MRTILVGTVIIGLVALMFWKHHQHTSIRRLKSFTKKSLASFGVNSELTVLRVQENIVDAVLKAGQRTIDSNRRILGNTIRVHISPEAAEKLQPLGERATRGIKDAIVSRGKDEGYEVFDNFDLHIGTDRQLSGLEVSSPMQAIDERTPIVSSTQDARGSQSTTQVPETFWLHVLNSPESPFEVGYGTDISIGRSRAADFRVTDTHISAIHANVAGIHNVNGAPQLKITDAGSTNGTYVRGDRLEPGMSSSIESGQTFRVGNCTIRAVTGKSWDVPTPSQ